MMMMKLATSLLLPLLLAVTATAQSDLLCPILPCCEEDCCGPNTSWDGQECVVDPGALGWTGPSSYSASYDPATCNRICCAALCCGEGTTYNSNIDYCVVVTASPTEIKEIETQPPTGTPTDAPPTTPPSEPPSESPTILVCNFVIVSGAQGVYNASDPSTEDWGNYVLAPLKMNEFENPKFMPEPCEEITWFVYCGGYNERWEDDVNRDAADVQAVLDEGYENYVDKIESEAVANGWNFTCVSTEQELWDKLKDFEVHPFSRLWYFGLGGDDSVLLTLDPEAHEVVEEGDIDDNLVPQLFNQRSKNRFYTCDAISFATTFSQVTDTDVVTCDGVCDYSSILDPGSATKGEPQCDGDLREYDDDIPQTGVRV